MGTSQRHDINTGVYENLSDSDYMSSFYVDIRPAPSSHLAYVVLMTAVNNQCNLVMRKCHWQNVI
jgi:hypothetical protein